MRIAWLTPLSPLRTAIADVSEGLLPHFPQAFETEIIVEDGYRPNNPEIVGKFHILKWKDFAAVADEYDALVYNIGDDPTFHGYMYPLLLEHPGVVILHDVTLQHLIVGLTLARGDAQAYIEEMRYAYGEDGARVARRYIENGREELLAGYPLTRRVLEAGTAFIVHNRYAARQIQLHRPKAQIAYIPQQYFLPKGLSQTIDSDSLRAEMGLSGRTVIGSFGFFVPDKRLHIALRAFARFRKRHPDSVYLFVGGHSPFYDLPGLVERLGLQDCVRITGWLDAVPFVRHMFAVDVAIQLRYPHIGGMPYTPIRLMGLGIPTIVTNIDPLADIPDNCLIKIDPNEDEEDLLLSTIEELASNDGFRQRLSANARRYVLKHHDARAIAQRYVDFISEVVAHPIERRTPAKSTPITGGGQLIHAIAGLACEIGMTEEDTALLRPLAESISELEELLCAPKEMQ